MFGTLNLDYKRNKPAKHVAYLFALRERNRRKIGSSFAFREAASSPRYEKREAIPPPTPARFAPRPPPTSSPPYRAGPGAARLPPPAPSPPHRALVSSPPAASWRRSPASFPLRRTGCRPRTSPSPLSAAPAANFLHRPLRSAMSPSPASSPPRRVLASGLLATAPGRALVAGVLPCSSSGARAVPPKEIAPPFASPPFHGRYG
jgi:hypothetical protein